MFAFTRFSSLLIVAIVLVAQTSAARAQTEVDLELVLAVDISNSMDSEEQRLQREGYVQALRDPSITKAIQGGLRGRIAVTYMEWAGPQIQTVVIPWRLIEDQASAAAFATELMEKPYRRFSMTSISSALQFASTLFGTSEFRGSRRVVDVSGDGVNNSGVALEPVRQDLLKSGVTINGLPILIRPTTTWSRFDAPNLDLYYANCVIGGPGSFMIPITTLDEFTTATRRKLLLEISQNGQPRLFRAQFGKGETGYDCSAVERRIDRW